MLHMEMYYVIEYSSTWRFLRVSLIIFKNLQLKCILHYILNVLFSLVPTPVRLTGGAGPWEGRVEILHNGQWGTICDTSFGTAEASVICKMIGFKEM